ncbi:glycoside hydrolase family 65 protein [Sinosporangium siamense]|uniref:Glycosyl hydrolase n=1 Tax=Sinosporangium siamense TaxID=1367973 RepID=A0A919RQI7_9ACTN|nr:glycoside hydrolase family 65 protein [Sinosporangium siamense]GII96384.1 glycosyl hydrolase [Sinosporangium siamense]
MISHPAYAIEPWCLRETELHLEVLAQSESVFALSNGHFGWRGNLDEGEPHGLPGTYLNGVYESHPLPYAEIGYGNPVHGQTILNVTNGKIIRLLVDDTPFDLRYGRLESHERVLDLRSGLLHRDCVWTSPTGRRIRVRSTRLVSLTQRAVAAVAFEVEPLDEDVRVVVQSELIANEQLPEAADGDPRVSTVLAGSLQPEEDVANGTRLRLIHRTAVSGIRVAAAADHTVSGCEQAEAYGESGPDIGRFTVTALLPKGRPLRLEKLVSYGWSRVRSLPAMRDQVEAALTGARSTGWQGLLDEQRAYLDAFWAGADVEVDGDTEIQQAVRFALFHVLQAGARAEGRAIAAKGLTGSGYDGHCFWDTETFVLPVLTCTAPRAAAEELRWRQRTLPKARERAAQLGLRGAAFPWRTIQGVECSGYWPAGTAAFHINADIADAVTRYLCFTDDKDFEVDCALELLVETARLWRSLGYHDAEGRFHIDGVTGPDEYTAVRDDNLYTNLMARSNLRAAADLAQRHPEPAAALGVDDEEAASWRDAARAIVVPYNPDLKVHEQCEGFTRFQSWDFADTPPERYPLLLHYPYFDLYRKQVVKQADLVLAILLHGEEFTAEEKARAFAYYEPLTVRDSSLSACCQAVVAAEVGHMRLAYDYLGEAALMDLEDLQHNTRDGLHIASLAGTWFAVVGGFGGMRHRDDQVHFCPRIPENLTRLRFTVQLRGQRLQVEIDHRDAVYTLAGGPPLTVRHHGEEVTLTSGRPEVRRVPPLAGVGPEPAQPHGRRPAPRGPREPEPP